MVNDTLTHFQINNGVNSLFYFRISAGAEVTGEQVTAQEEEANPLGCEMGPSRDSGLTPSQTRRRGKTC